MKIIYIEDDPTNQLVVSEMLAATGLAPTLASDATTGLQMLEAERFDLVIIDLRLPDISGLTAIRQLRARVRNGQRVPILVASAELSSGVQDMCLAAGADGFLPKPIAMEKLYEAIADLMADTDAALIS